MRVSVLLPLPLGPRIARTTPAGTVQSTPRRIHRSPRCTPTSSPDAVDRLSWLFRRSWHCVSFAAMSASVYSPPPRRVRPAGSEARGVRRHRAALPRAARPADRLARRPGAVAGRLVGAVRRRSTRSAAAATSTRAATPTTPRSSGVHALRRGDRAEDQAAVLPAQKKVPRLAAPRRAGAARPALRDARAAARRGACELFRDENVPLETEATKLVNEYDKTCGAMTVTFRGKELHAPAARAVPRRARPRDARGGVAAQPSSGGCATARRSSRSSTSCCRCATRSRATRACSDFRDVHVEGVQAVRLHAGRLPALRRRDRGDVSCRSCTSCDRQRSATSGSTSCARGTSPSTRRAARRCGRSRRTRSTRLVDEDEADLRAPVAAARRRLRVAAAQRQPRPRQPQGQAAGRIPGVPRRSRASRSSS